MDTILDTLLYRAEDTTVEFKSAQYVISRPNNVAGQTAVEAKRAFEQKKSELLKDVLAMANSWRDGPGYIVIGAREGKGGPAEVIGLPDDALHDDAVIQQFIGSKLAHPLQFSYAVIDYQGQKVGIIAVPKQNGRPFYAKEDYGVVQRQVVYVRRGSSTATADPMEIARMGRDEVSVPKTAEVDFLAENNGGESLLNTRQDITIQTFGDISEICDYVEARGPFYMGLNSPNRQYYRELAHWMQEWSSTIAIQVSLRSRSNHVLRECKLELVVTDSAGRRLDVLEESDLPLAPKRYNGMRELNLSNLRFRDAPETMTILDGGACVFGFRLLRAGETVAAPSKIYVRISDADSVNLSFRLLSEDLSKPLEFKGSFDVQPTFERWEETHLIAWGDRTTEPEDA